MKHSFTVRVNETVIFSFNSVKKMHYKVAVRACITKLRINVGKQLFEFTNCVLVALATKKYLGTG